MTPNKQGIEKAIERAIEGGWKPKYEIMPKEFIWTPPFKVFVAGNLTSFYFETKVKGAIKENIVIHTSDILLDPRFWQALGKAEWWTSDGTQSRFSEMTHKEFKERHWQTHWHRFIDHLAECKPIDDYFNELLND